MPIVGSLLLDNFQSRSSIAVIEVGFFAVDSEDSSAETLLSNLQPKEVPMLAANFASSGIKVVSTRRCIWASVVK